MSTVAVIDYGMGNLRSVAKALEFAGSAAGLTSLQVYVGHDPEKILNAERIVFPGVGALGSCMSELKRLGMDEVIRESLATTPLLGICLGMQALLKSSEENGGTAGLGIIPGVARHFALGHANTQTGGRLKIPHMGWNQVQQTQAHPLWQGIEPDSRFYFVHSYYVVPDAPDCIVGSTTYGTEFTSAIASDNLFAVQFHPEKSQQAGLRLLANFLRWDGKTEV